MAQMSPYLSFPGNCSEVMNYYQQCLGGELLIQTVAESPAAEHMPAEAQGSVIHSQLTIGNMILMASDILDGSTAVNSNTFTVCIHSGTREEMTAFFEKFAPESTVTMPLSEAFFGFFGSVTDKYGIHWAFQAE